MDSDPVLNGCRKPRCHYKVFFLRIVIATYLAYEKLNNSLAVVKVVRNKAHGAEGELLHLDLAGRQLGVNRLVKKSFNEGLVLNDAGHLV
jgi:hypothetical protein